MPEERENSEQEAEKDAIEVLQAKERDEAEQRLAEANKRAQDAEVAKARAEGENEALRRLPQAPQVQNTQWTEEQWESEAAKNGMTGQQLKASVQIADAIATTKMKPFEDRAKAAEQAANEARQEAKQAKAGNSLYAVEQEFYSKNPTLTGHRGDVDAFLSKLPQSVKDDPKQFAEALDMAKTYVRGKAREGVFTRRTTENRTTQRTEERQQFADDNEQREPESEVDLSDLENEGSRALISRLHKNPGPDYLAGSNEAPLSEVTLEEAYKRTQMKDGTGVSIDERSDWARGNRRSDQALRNSDGVGGKRGK